MIEDITRYIESGIKPQGLDHLSDYQILCELYKHTNGAIQEALDEAYDMGYEDGYDSGVEDGYDRGTFDSNDAI